MTALITLLAVAAFLFAGGFARARYGELRLSELPVLLLALLAGSEEKRRLRLILRNRTAPRRETEKETTARWERDKEAPKRLVVMRTARECYCNTCAAPLGIYHFRDAGTGRAYCFPCREQAREHRYRETTETTGEQ